MLQQLWNHMLMRIAESGQSLNIELRAPASLINLHCQDVLIALLIRDFCGATTNKSIRGRCPPPPQDLVPQDGTQ